jgi:hypothetical protein
MFKALHEVVSKAGANMSDASRQAILGLIDEDASRSDGNKSKSRSPQIILDINRP